MGWGGDGEEEEQEAAPEPTDVLLYRGRWILPMRWCLRRKLFQAAGALSVATLLFVAPGSSTAITPPTELVGGTRGVAPMPYTDVFGRKRYRNVEVNIDEETLQKIAELTGGKYLRADSQRALREIYDKIDKMEKTEVEVDRFFNYDELFPYLAIAGMTLLLLELILANTVWLKLP